MRFSFVQGGGDKLWKDFLVSMLTLFRVLTFEDWTDVMYEAMELHSWAWIYFVSFVIIAALAASSPPICAKSVSIATIRRCTLSAVIIV